jgi:RNA polymerase sigma-70 factor (ECF subfamily)
MTWTTEDGRSGGEPGETHLLEGCKKGDRTAQRKLFDSLAPKMMALCLRYTGDSQTAEDVLQDGFVTLFTRLDSYSGKGSFEGWARKIFVNTALMHLRRTDALKLSDPLDGAAPLSSPEETPSQALGYKELLSLVSRLPAGYRTVFNMYAVEGFTHREIAESLGITEATSRSKLMRARALLQEMIKTGH